MCRFCNSVFTTPNVVNFIKDFVPPTTSTRTIKGIAVWAADTDGASRMTMDTDSTRTKQKAVDVPSSGCGKSGQTTKLSTLGQTVEFTIKSPVPLAVGQFIFWEDNTAKNFQTQVANAANFPTNSVSCTCGSYTWAATMKKVSATQLSVVMPAAAVGATSQVICAAGDVSCKVREWSQGSTAVTAMTATCYACDNGGAACTKTKSTTTDNTANDLGVAKNVAGVTFTFTQNGAAATTPDVLKVRDVKYQPHTKAAIGRFYYKPSTAMPLYATSTIAYTFGSQTFGSGAICQVMTSSGTAPSGTTSDLVRTCAISGSVVTVTMAKDSTANFHVQIVGMNAWAATAGTVTGTVSNFGNAVQTAGTASATNVHTALSVVGTTATSCNDVSAVTTTVTLARSLVNVMDVGMLAFTITPQAYDWGVNDYAFISFPTYYNPNVGDMLRCSLYDTKTKADSERLYCAMAWDYTLQVWGPATA